MKIISPKFLESMNSEAHREKILCELFKYEDIFSIIMLKKGMKFDEACEWVATRTSVGLSKAPEATESEKTIMKRVAQELIDEFKEKNDNTPK